MSVESSILHLPSEYRGRTAPRLFNGKFQPTSVFVHNARELPQPPTLEKDKLCLIQHTTQVKDWGDADEVQRVWYTEAAEIMKGLTGCTDVFFVGHLVRDHKLSDAKSLEKTTKQAFYATFAHSDVSAYTSQFQPASFEKLRGRHWAQYNIWRSIDADSPVLGNPLALLNPASTAIEDLVLTQDPPTLSEYFRSKAGDADSMKRMGSYAPFRLAPNPNHQWLYFDKMQFGEAMIFLQFDTREQRPTMRQVFHSSFQNPLVPASAPPRRSCELRVLCVFDDEDKDFAANMAHMQAQFPSMLSGARL